MYSLFRNETPGLSEETQGDQCNTGGNIVHIVFLLVVMLFGVPGSSLILRVYWGKPRKTSTHVLIMGLAWTDLSSSLFLVHAIITNCIFAIGESPTPLVILRYFLMCSVTVSVVITSMIAFDRYDCVCRPTRCFLNYRRAICAILIAVIYSLGSTGMYFAVLRYHDESDFIPMVMLLLQIIGYATAVVMNGICYGKVYQTIRRHVKVATGHAPIDPPKQAYGKSVRIRMTDKAVKSCEASSVPSMATELPSEIKLCRVQFSGDMIARNSDPGPSTRGCNNGPLATNAARGKGQVQTNFQQNCDQRQRPFDNSQGSSNPEPRASAVVLQRKTTRMLLVTNVVFLLAWVPYWIYVGSMVATIQGVRIPDKAVFVMEKCAYIEYLNSAVNPFIYGLANRRFRKDCKEAFQKCKFC